MAAECVHREILDYSARGACGLGVGRDIGGGLTWRCECVNRGKYGALLRVCCLRRSVWSFRGLKAILVAISARAARDKCCPNRVGRVGRACNGCERGFYRACQVCMCGSGVITYAVITAASFLVSLPSSAYIYVVSSTCRHACASVAATRKPGWGS